MIATQRFNCKRQCSKGSSLRLVFVFSCEQQQFVLLRTLPEREKTA
jgi:hypothetical protein